MCVSSNWFHTHNRLYDRSRKREMRSLSGALGDFATRLRVYKVWIHGGVEWKATGVECATIGCGLCARGTLLHLIHPGASNGAFPRATPPSLSLPSWNTHYRLALHNRQRWQRWRRVFNIFDHIDPQRLSSPIYLFRYMGLSSSLSPSGIGCVGTRLIHSGEGWLLNSLRHCENVIGFLFRRTSASLTDSNILIGTNGLNMIGLDWIDVTRMCYN